MNALLNYHKTLDAGLATSKQFAADQTLVTMEVIRDAHISHPKLIRKGDNVSVSLRSKNKTAVVTIRGRPLNCSPRNYDYYVNMAIQLAKDDMLTLEVNNALLLNGSEGCRVEERAAMWKDEVTRVLGNNNEVDEDLLANACLCYSAAINTLIADLMMEAMEETDNEGLKLCFANRAKIFHGHATSNEHALEAMTHGSMTIKTVLL